MNEMNLMMLSAVDEQDRPQLEIDPKKMQYRRYERLYPNSTCKEHCDAKKGLVPYLQVRSMSPRDPCRSL